MKIDDRDWRLPENRRLAFMRFYRFTLKHKAHPGMVYSWLPALAEHYQLDADGRAWAAWLNGNTQNPVMTSLLLGVAPTHYEWKRAVNFFEVNAPALDWDSDRRHQKYAFHEATAKWATDERWGAYPGGPANAWIAASRTWDDTWAFANAQPFMGRLSTWSMIEFARILLNREPTPETDPNWAYNLGRAHTGYIRIPDADTLLLDDLSGSRSHRNGLAILAGDDYHEAAYYDAQRGTWTEDRISKLKFLGKLLLIDALQVNAGEPWAADVGYLTMESALCTYKSWHKPQRRYPGVYADMAYGRLRKAEERFGDAGRAATAPLWEARRRDLPAWLRLESSPTDPGLSARKQNFYLQTGHIPVLGRDEWPAMWTEFDTAVEEGRYGLRA